MLLDTDLIIDGVTIFMIGKTTKFWGVIIDPS